MKTEVAVKQSTEVSTELMGSWGAGGGEDLEASDIMTPKILLMQKTSSLIDEGVARSGDALDSLDHTKLGDEKHPIEIIVVDRNPKKWKISDVSGAIPKFMRYEEYRLEDSELPWTFTENNTPCRRDKVLTYTCLLVREGQEISDNLPYHISFARSLINSAKRMQTTIEKLKVLGRPSAYHTFILTPKKESKNDVSWYTYDVKVGRKTTEEELKIAKLWYDKLRSGAIKLQEHEVEVEEAPVEPVEAPKYAKPRETYTVDDADADYIEF